ncbi:succinate dehydrogenase assembly factor 2 [Gammaproteobacteria bacterium]|nr:succinate dehydrogenase assembly factor 2 [Gammaproteobacteria bacterium]
MMNEVELKKMWWHSRRGMLELDLLLLPFATDKLAQLDDSQQKIYQRLLEQEDQDLFSWLIEKEVAPDSELIQMIQMILANNDSQIKK